MFDFAARWKAGRTLWRQRMARQYFPDFNQLPLIPPWKAQKHAKRGNMNMLQHYIDQVGAYGYDYAYQPDADADEGLPGDGAENTI